MRREPLPQDVQLEILYCGVCHSDLHTVRNEWKGTTFPVVPGHEIVGRVTAVGNAVRKFKVGDPAAVGVIVDSDRVWEEFGREDPYYSVCTDDRFRGARLDEDARSQFFASGDEHVANVLAVIQSRPEVRNAVDVVRDASGML